MYALLLKAQVIWTLLIRICRFSHKAMLLNDYLCPIPTYVLKARNRISRRHTYTIKVNSKIIEVTTTQSGK